MEDLIKARQSRIKENILGSFMSEAETLSKAIETDFLLEKGKKANIGEIREWRGKKFQKQADGWKPVKESSSKNIQEKSDDQLKQMIEEGFEHTEARAELKRRQESSKRKPISEGGGREKGEETQDIEVKNLDSINHTRVIRWIHDTLDSEDVKVRKVSENDYKISFSKDAPKVWRKYLKDYLKSQNFI